MTSRISSKAVPHGRAPLPRDGNAFEVAGKSFFVDKACSGINSLYSTLAVTWFCILFFWRRLDANKVFLNLAAVFWVLIANITRG